MTRRGIRMFAQNENLKFDDNISVPVLLTNLAALGIPMVPVLQNCTVPPIPDQHRCYAVGEALGDFIRNDLPADMRVALLGSGGLSPRPRARRCTLLLHRRGLRPLVPRSCRLRRPRDAFEGADAGEDGGRGLRR